MLQVMIGDYVIHKEAPPFIVAEVGINHNGDLNTAYQMIEVAKNSGANAVKFQTYVAHEFITDHSQLFSYFSQGKKITEPMLTMFERCEFSIAEWQLIKRKCDDIGIMFLSTPQNYSDLKNLLTLGINAIKVGSDDFNNIPLLKRYASTGLPLILSSGMATLAEIYTSLEAIGCFEGYPTILLLCTSQYPTPPQDVNLNKLKTLSAAFPSLPLGFSDHTQGPLASSLAVAMGACVFEKHITLSHDMSGPDHWFSEDPAGLVEWVKSIKQAYQMMGSAIVRPTVSEISMKAIARRSIVASEAISAGDIFSEENIVLKKPGIGLPPILLEKILGLRAARNIEKNTLLNFGDFIDDN